jgi:predicted transcriptional regulator
VSKVISEVETQLSTQIKVEPGAHFEIWNEPNLDQHWSGGVSPKGYVKLARSVSKVISEVETQLSTQIKVVGPAIGGSYVDYDFLEKSFKLGLLNFIDEVSIHSYGIGNPENSRTVFDNIRQLMKKYGKVLPLSITEAGFSSLDKTESDQAKRLKEFLEISLEQNISRVMIYQWQDELVSSQYVEAHFGLLRKDGTKKSSYYVVKDFLDKSQKNLIYNLVRLVGFY